MQPTQWNLHHIKQCEQMAQQRMLSDEHSLFLFANDFGNVIHAPPQAVFEPDTLNGLQKIIQYANSNKLPVTIRGNGMSQNGQSLVKDGGITFHMGAFDKVLKLNEQSIWVEANTSWSTVLEHSLMQSMIPLVIPYNCNLSVAGVLSAGGIGASSFKYGNMVSHVEALEVVTADGELHQVDDTSPLFHACLGGQGRFGIITKICIPLRKCHKNIRTFFLVYLDKDSWLKDINTLKPIADFMECFASPSIQGAKLCDKGRLPFAQWLYALHVSFEYNEVAPDWDAINQELNPWKMLHSQDEGIESYLHRHDSRFNAMKKTGQWELPHLWYECFVPAKVLVENFDHLLNSLPLYYATVLQIVPVANNVSKNFSMLPEAGEVFAAMILNPGLPASLVDSTIDTVKFLDSLFLPHDGKRYLSGFVGRELDSDYWSRHFGTRYKSWIELKEHYDPNGIFSSFLYRE